MVGQNINPRWVVNAQYTNIPLNPLPFLTKLPHPLGYKPAYLKRPLLGVGINVDVDSICLPAKKARWRK